MVVFPGLLVMACVPCILPNGMFSGWLAIWLIGRLAGFGWLALWLAFSSGCWLFYWQGGWLVFLWLGEWLAG